MADGVIERVAGPGLARLSCMGLFERGAQREDLAGRSGSQRSFSTAAMRPGPD